MKEEMSEFEEDGMVTDAQLKTIAGLIKQQVLAEAKVSDLEGDLKEANKKLRKVSEVDLPDAMAAANFSLFKTDDGLLVEIDEKMSASISKKNKPAAIEWLMKNNLESLVKENVVVPFDKGESEKVKSFIEILEANGVSDFSVAPTVNTSSVKSALKELIEDGVEVPTETFGIFFMNKAKITTP